MRLSSFQSVLYQRFHYNIIIIHCIEIYLVIRLLLLDAVISVERIIIS